MFFCNDSEKFKYPFIQSISVLSAIPLPVQHEVVFFSVLWNRVSSYSFSSATTITFKRSHARVLIVLSLISTYNWLSLQWGISLSYILNINIMSCAYINSSMKFLLLSLIKFRLYNCLIMIPSQGRIGEFFYLSCIINYETHEYNY